MQQTQQKQQEQQKSGLITRMKSCTRKMALGLALFHAGTQAAVWLNNLYQYHNPSPQRQAFQQEFGIPLKGWAEDIEQSESPKLVNILAAAFQREQVELPFDLNYVAVKPSSYAKKNLMQQLEQVFTVGFNGHFNPLFDGIVLNAGAGPDTIHHEIKHAKTLEVLRRHPELKHRWKALALDNNGNSLYLNSGEQVCSKLKGLYHFVPKEKQDYRENEKLGFITSYARTNVYEDIAETCEIASHSSPSLDTLSVCLNQRDPDRTNPKLLAKIRLAQEYGLMPEEFIEYVNLYQLHLDAWKSYGHGCSLDADTAHIYMNASATFLKRHPKSVYAAEVHRERARMLKERATSMIPTASLEDAIAEFKACLQSPMIDTLPYVCALNDLKGCYLDLGDPSTASLYQDAHALYWKRWNEADLRAVTIGVNDFLAYLNQLPPAKHPIPTASPLDSPDFQLSCAPATHIALGW